MNKQICVEYQGKEYTLEYTRKSVETMERNGFVASDINDKPMTTLPALFAGAFLANHRWVKQEVIDAIFARMTNKGELIGKLAEMYNDTLNALVDEPDENEGNLNWTASW